MVKKTKYKIYTHTLKNIKRNVVPYLCKQDSLGHQVLASLSVPNDFPELEDSEGKNDKTPNSVRL